MKTYKYIDESTMRHVTMQQVENITQLPGHAENLRRATLRSFLVFYFSSSSPRNPHLKIKRLGLYSTIYAARLLFAENYSRYHL